MAGISVGTTGIARGGGLAAAATGVLLTDQLSRTRPTERKFMPPQSRPFEEPNWASLWPLEPGIDFLNHGSFGACPRAVLDRQSALRERMEREPVDFFLRRLEGLLDEAREVLAAFVGAEPECLAFVPNATSGVNTVLRSLRFEPGDELLTTNHRYNACRNALELTAQTWGARVVEAEIPLPVASPERVVEAVLERVSARTRLVLLDHVTSPTGLVFPVERLVAELAQRGVETLVDGAHAPGMLELELSRLGAAYYAGNCHKWLCAPKGAGFLYVRGDRLEAIRPLVVSHGASARTTRRSRFRLEFDWLGTVDPSAFLCVPEAIDFLGSLLPGGWPELRERNRRLALEARSVLEAALGVQPIAPAAMIGSLAAVRIPDGSPEPPASPLYADPLNLALFEHHGIEVPVLPWPAPPRRLLRVSAQIYNRPQQYARLASALLEQLDRTASAH